MSETWVPFELKPSLTGRADIWVRRMELLSWVGDGVGYTPTGVIVVRRSGIGPPVAPQVPPVPVPLPAGCVAGPLDARSASYSLNRDGSGERGTPTEESRRSPVRPRARDPADHRGLEVPVPRARRQLAGPVSEHR